MTALNPHPDRLSPPDHLSPVPKPSLGLAIFAGGGGSLPLSIGL